MPDKDFLENFPLFKSIPLPSNQVLDRVPKPTIKMFRSDCGDEQTYVMTSDYYDGAPYTNFPSAGWIAKVMYVCVGCKRNQRCFVVRFADDGFSVTKIGQYPSWDIAGNKEVEKLLGSHKSYLWRGQICESQGYGIGAFAYYRRIVEEVIDALLNEIGSLIDEQQKATYSRALANVAKTRVTAEKIDIVKDLLPPILRPDGMNPLKLLHETLSEGIHAESDQKCLELAQTLREILVFLATQVDFSKSATKAFTANMKSILDKKSGKGA